MGKFTELAKKATWSLSIMDDHKKLKQEQIIAAYPEGVTIIAAGLCPVKDKKTGEADLMSVYLFKEDETSYGVGGMALRNIFESWVKDYDGDFERMSADLRAEGGVKIKIEKTTTSENKPFFAASVVE